MRQRKKVWSICLVIALVFSSIFTWNEPALTAYASETKTEKIVVYVAAQGKSLDGTKTVAIDKTPVQVDKGTNAAAAVKAVLDASDYKDNYDIPDTGYGPYLESINGMGTEQAGKNWYYWSFYVNGQYSNVGMGSYVLQEGDQISLIYTYDDLSTEASVFADDTSLNPETPAVESAEASMKKGQGIAAKEIYNSYFADGHIPGLGSVNELYAVFSLARAGFEAPEFYGKVKYKLTRQLKELATGIIRSNEQGGVPVFIQCDSCTVRQYDKQSLYVSPDNARFSACTATADSGDGVGILNEKQIHATLKSYFAATLFDKEIKIGSYFADLVTENGIFEIQTANFSYLVPKLNTFLKASHVTIVYPFHKKSRLNYVDKATGEILSSGRNVTASDMTDFFLELYRIRQYLNDPNLTVCIADIAVENLRYCAKDMKRRKTDRKVAVPTSLLRLTFLEDSDSYRCFIPEGLPETFTLKEFRKCMRSGDASIAIKILQYVGVIDYIGKRGNEYLYKIT